MKRNDADPMQRLFARVQRRQAMRRALTMGTLEVETEPTRSREAGPSPWHPSPVYRPATSAKARTSRATSTPLVPKITPLAPAASSSSSLARSSSRVLPGAAWSTPDEPGVVYEGGAAPAMRSTTWAGGKPKHRLPEGEGPTMPERPLAGVRVLDFTWVRAGPWATRWLAVLGAEVIKVEWPDPALGAFTGRLPITRAGTTPEGVPPGLNSNGHFSDQNAHKLSVTINTRSERGLELVRRLVAASDVVIENFSTGVLERWGLGYEQMALLRSDIRLRLDGRAWTHGTRRQLHDDGSFRAGALGADIPFRAAGPAARRVGLVLGPGHTGSVAVKRVAPSGSPAFTSERKDRGRGGRAPASSGPGRSRKYGRCASRDPRVGLRRRRHSPQRHAADP